MSVTATNGLITRDFSCQQYALLGSTLPAGWTLTVNTCGLLQANFLTPYAASGLAGNGTTVAKGKWYLKEATVGAPNANRVMLPLTFLLPADASGVRLVVRRQQYLPSEPGAARDFTVNIAENSLDLDPAKTGNLNGQKCTVEVFF